MTSLMDKLRSADKGSRGLDGLIARDIEGWLPSFGLEGDKITEWTKMGGHWHQPGDPCDHTHSVDWGENGLHRDPPHYTTSVDAALAFAERECPGCVLTILTYAIARAEVSEDQFREYLPLAICIETIQTKETNND